MLQKQLKKPALRKCIGCMEYKEKKDLIRLCKCDDGHITADYDLKSGGRGAYICKNSECVLQAQKRRALEHSFKTRVAKEDYDALLEAINLRQTE